MRTVVLLVGLISILFIVVYVHTYNQESFNLRILHFNDLHDHLTAATKQQTPTISQLSHLIEKNQSGEIPTLVLVAGDLTSGSIESTLFSQVELLSVYNEIGINIFGPGNHEFDYGLPRFLDFIDLSKFTVLTGNLQSDQIPSEHIKPYKIVTFNGIDVGVVSVTTTETTKLAPAASDLNFVDEKLFLEKTISELTEAGIKIIVVISHVGYEKDLELAKTLEDIDVIVGGHSDTYLNNHDSDAPGSYPTVVEKENGQKVLIVQTKPYGQALGKLDIKFDKRGVVSGYSGEPLLITEDTPADANIANMVNKLYDSIPAPEPVGVVHKSFNLNYLSCRTAQCDIGRLVTDSLLWTGQKYQVDAAFINSGAFRSPLNERKITNYDISRLLPFDDTVTISTVTGSELIDMMTYSNELRAIGHGGYLQYSGLSATSDCPLKIASTNEYIQPKKYYKIISSSFLTEGGDGYNVIENSTSTEVTIHSAVEKFLKLNTPYQPTADNKARAECNVDYQGNG